MLVIPTDEAVMFVVLPAVIPVARPELSIVATVVSLEVQVAKSVMTTGPLHVAAVAMNWSVLPWVTVGFTGVTAMELIQGTVTVTVVDPKSVGISVDVAVTVAVPWFTAVTSPPALTVATFVPVTSTMLHVTLESGRTPSSYVPTAVICLVLLLVPV